MHRFPLLLGWILTSYAQKVGANDYFYVLNTQQGLSDNCILQMMQLADGRLAVRTPKDINLYDGRRFSLIPLPAEKAESITKYKGQTHLYADSQDRLWVKEYQKIICFIPFPPFSITFAAEIQSDVFGTGKIINPLI